MKNNNIILTRHGCTCKDSYTYRGKTYKNKCIIDHNFEPWCIVNEKKCGKLMNPPEKGEWQDFCNLSNVSDNRFVFSRELIKQNIKGMLIFLIIFVLIIPLLLNKFMYYDFLEIYMPNFDLLATALMYNFGPGDTRYFQFLFQNDPQTTYAYLSQFFIKFLSLIGVVYLVARRSILHNSILIGFTSGLVMVCMTYLLPNDIIIYIQDKFDIYFKKYGGQHKYIKYILGVSIGLLTALFFIFIEKYIIKYQRYFLVPFIKFLFTKLKLM